MEAAAKPPVSPFLRLALDAGPLLVFFVVNGFAGLMVGTGAFMAATAVSLVFAWRLERRVPLMPLISCGFVMLFGGLTLALDNEIFIKMKPTVLYLLFAAVLFIGLVTGRTYLSFLMGSMLTLTDAGWRALTWRWAVFFVVMAVVNEVVWRSFSTDVWISFKLFGFLPLTLLYAAAQVPLIMKHQPRPEVAA